MAIWLLTKAADELFKAITRQLLISAGLATSPEVQQSRLLDQYSRTLEQRLTGTIQSRLDEDRIAKLAGAIASSVWHLK